MNVRGMIKAYLGILAILGLLMLVVPLIDILYNEPVSVSFLLLGEILLILGLLARSIESKPLTTIEALIVGVSSWVSIPLISAIALSYESNTSYLDSAFESISGFTGTGFTVFHPSKLKHSLILWRSLMQWSGELGFVVFAMVFIPYFYDVAKKLYGIERPVKIEASFYRTASKLLVVYATLTGGGILAYYLSGMNFFDSVNYVMTTIATGGMATYDEGYDLIFHKAPLTALPVVILMIIGGMNFYDVHNLLTGKFKDLIKSEELKYYLLIISSIPLLTITAYIFVEGYSVTYSLIAGFFNSISGITTTGFSIGSLSKLSDTTKALFIIGMYVGGMTFSTAGGIKALRFMILIKKFKSMASSMILPSYVVHKASIKRVMLRESDISNALFVALMHAFIVFVSALIISAFGYSFIDSLFEATSAASCVGLSVGVITPASPPLIKIILMILMVTGRLEYIPLLLLVSLMVSRRALHALKW